jgi:hypothetical protein
MPVLNGEREAEVTIAGAELPLEISGPGSVRLFEIRERRPRVRASSARLGMVHPAVTNEDPVNRVHRGDPRGNGIVTKQALKLTSSPPATLLEQEDPFDDLRRGCMRAGNGTSGAVLEAVEALPLKAPQPLVAGRPADPMATAEFGKGKVGHLGFENEAGAFGLHGRGTPWHRALQVGGGPCLHGEL